MCGKLNEKLFPRQVVIQLPKIYLSFTIHCSYVDLKYDCFMFLFFFPKKKTITVLHVYRQAGRQAGRQTETDRHLPSELSSPVLEVLTFSSGR